MKHYICKGECGGVSDEKKNCDSPSCSRFNKELIECSCTDGKHNDKKE